MTHVPFSVKKVFYFMKAKQKQQQRSKNLIPSVTFDCLKRLKGIQSAVRAGH